ncbi:class I SAM-dependent methyltransferase [Methylobacter sp. BBA5.1]|jgi:ubiquinone/menaquinone biosynthesis C-methylase UbiE|uniref:class I SAM-dependent methyltransferase n=1 Tax=Methylobacter sp. BBA5.1 TaxID=1495064 RepID=UPI0005677D03|nr:methyltransferase domain-containing protein [Methylobacter sp. BBA5.1]
MALTKTQLRDLYRVRAVNYDFTANLYYLIGFREVKYRKQAVSALGLNPGDTVVEIGCGTGLNFPYLLEAIGETGRLIGVDFTDAMLEKAREKIYRNRWQNVELVEADAARYEFPDGIQGVFSTFALTLVPEYEQVINHAARALANGGRLVVTDFKKPDRWPLWLVKLGVLITKPFGVTLDLTDRKPWEVMMQYFSRVTVTELFTGSVYIAVGENS